MTNTPEGDRRIPYWALPNWLHVWVERQLASTVTGASSHASGSSLGCASTIELTSGRKVFIKAQSSALNARSRTMLDEEARVLTLLPPTELLPQYYASVSRHGWTAILCEHVEGAPPNWDNANDRRLVFQASTELQRALRHRGADLELRTADRSVALWHSAWSPLVQDHGKQIPDWAKPLIGGLVARSATASKHVMGSDLLHWDLRSDNIVLRPPRTVFVDWGKARMGRGWIDVGLLCSQDLELLKLYATNSPQHAHKLGDVIASLVAWRTVPRVPTLGTSPNLVALRGAEARVLWKALKWIIQHFG